MEKVFEFKDLHFPMDMDPNDEDDLVQVDVYYRIVYRYFDTYLKTHGEDKTREYYNS